MATDWKALCAELCQEFASLYSDMSACTDFNETYAERVDALIARTRSALSQPEPQPYRDAWDMTTEEGSMCFAICIYAALVSGEPNESDLTWLANYLRVNSAACRPAVEPPAKPAHSRD